MNMRMFHLRSIVPLTFLFFLSSFHCRTLSVVETTFGEVEGFEEETADGVPVFVYLGIRYGQAPDVYNRFEKPEQVEKWHFRHYATRFPARCIPFHEDALSEDENFSEDCLFINIISPTRQPEAGLPVLFYIHGGGFQIGSPAELGYKKIARQVAAKGVVVVTVQYRLGPFGFFSLGDTEAPGNLGLWDLSLALHFVHEIIGAFGGDASRITVSGHSAGASSTSALLFSPHTQSLFSQAIEMSGSIFCEHSLSDAVVEESRKLAKELGCLKEGDSSHKIMACLKIQTAHDIIKAVDKIGKNRRHPSMLKFHPRIDGLFFPHSLERLAKSAPAKRTLHGFTDIESALFVLHPELEIVSGLIVKPVDWDSFSRENLTSFIGEVIASEAEHGDEAENFRSALEEFYVNGEIESSSSSSFYLSRFVDLVSDLQFVIPTYQELEVKRDNGWPTWFYVVDYHIDTGRLDNYPLKGAVHADELRFVFDLEEGGASEGNDAFRRIFNEALVNFVKKGDPSTPSLTWPRLSASAPFVHALLNPTPSIHQLPFRKEALDLWLLVLPKQVHSDALRRRLPGIPDTPRHQEL